MSRPVFQMPFSMRNVFVYVCGSFIIQHNRQVHNFSIYKATSEREMPQKWLDMHVLVCKIGKQIT